MGYILSDFINYLIRPFKIVDFRSFCSFLVWIIICIICVALTGVPGVMGSYLIWGLYDSHSQEKARIKKQMKEK